MAIIGGAIVSDKVTLFEKDTLTGAIMYGIPTMYYAIKSGKHGGTKPEDLENSNRALRDLSTGLGTAFIGNEAYIASLIAFSAAAYTDLRRRIFKEYSLEKIISNQQGNK